MQLDNYEDECSEFERLKNGLQSSLDNIFMVKNGHDKLQI